MTDFRALAMGIYRFTQVVSQADPVVQEVVLTSIEFAEVAMGDCPMRTERMQEFYRIAHEGD